MEDSLREPVKMPYTSSLELNLYEAKIDEKIFNTTSNKTETTTKTYL